jgi:hypothetical protein
MEGGRGCAAGQTSSRGRRGVERSGWVRYCECPEGGEGRGQLKLLFMHRGDDDVEHHGAAAHAMPAEPPVPTKSV